MHQSMHDQCSLMMKTKICALAPCCTCRLHEELLRAQGVLPSSNPALGVNRFREETAPVPQYLRAVGAPLPRAAGTGVHKTVQRDIEQLLAGMLLKRLWLACLCLLVCVVNMPKCSAIPGLQHGHVAAVCAHFFVG
jgi:hypothetical protein